MNAYSATSHPIETNRQVIEDAGDELSLASLVAAIWKRKTFVILPVLIVFLSTLAILTSTKSRYTSTAQILVDTPQSTFSRPQQENGQEATPDNLAVGSHEQLLLSRDLARDVTLRLDLAGQPEFSPGGQVDGIFQRFISLIGLSPNPGDLTAEENVINAYFDRLVVARVNDSRVIAVNFTSTDPRFAAEVANGVVDRYIETLRFARQQSTNDAAVWLEEQIDQLRNKVELAEARVASYRSANGLLLGASNATLSSQQLSELNTQLILARTARAESQARAQMINELLLAGGNLDSASDVLNSPLIQRLQEQMATLRRQIAQLSATLLPSHPQMLQLNAEITDLRRLIRSEAEKVVEGLQNEASIAGARENALRASLNSLSQDAGQNGGAEVELRALEREATAQRDLLESFLAKYREASAQQQLTALPVQARIISRATVSTEPSYPRTIPILLATTIGSALLAIAVLISAELVKAGATLNTGQMRARQPLPEPVDIQSPVEAVVDEEEPLGQPISIVSSQSNQSVSGAVTQTIAAVYEIGMSDEASRIIVCSPQRQNPDNYSSLNLARGIAHDGHKVVLIDGNMRASRIATQTGLKSNPGFSDLLAETHEFVHVLQRDTESRIHIISAGTHLSDPSRMIRQDRLEQVLDALEGTYDYIVIDGPPVLLASETQILAARCDCAVIVQDTLPGGQRLVDRSRDVLTDYDRQPMGIIAAEPEIAQRNAGAGIQEVILESA
jgi:tyrosine-protein kinase Etk/Wzc